MQKTGHPLPGLAGLPSRTVLALVHQKMVATTHMQTSCESSLKFLANISSVSLFYSAKRRLGVFFLFQPFSDISEQV